MYAAVLLYFAAPCRHAAAQRACVVGTLGIGIARRLAFRLLAPNTKRRTIQNAICAQGYI
jgi:hypothetical protein